MKRYCIHKCIDKEDCEILLKEKYEDKYNKYKKIYNTDNLKIKCLNKLEMKKGNLIQEKEKYSSVAIDRIISMTTLILAGCALLTGKNESINSKFEMYFLGLALFYIAYTAVNEHKNRIKYRKVLIESKEVNLDILVMKNLLYEEHNLVI